MTSDYVEWSDALALGIPEMDSQHRRLVDLTNHLHEAMLQRKSNEVLGDIIFRLIDYTKFHFRDEETCMIQSGFPQTTSHREKHQKFVSEMEKFKADFETGKTMLSMEIMDFLKGWLVEHIQHADHEYVSYFNESCRD